MKRAQSSNPAVSAVSGGSAVSHSASAAGWNLAEELRWSFTPPWTWLAGVATNLFLSLVWLVAVPLTGRRHSDWAIVIGTYFAVFILADVTTTNILGADAVRVPAALIRGVPLRRIIFLKNLVLLVIVGVPTLTATVLITIAAENRDRLFVTVPGVAFPVFTWLGVGNVVSVLLPVAVLPLRDRWRQRHQLGGSVRWLLHLSLPYVLLYAVDPVGDLPQWILRHSGLVATPLTRGGVHVVTGLVLWGLGTAIALLIGRRRPLGIR